jgi:ATP-dependent helicase HrpB
VLATAIAETSLTLDGVRVVVDAGLSRRAEFDKVAGVTRLVTTRASQAAAAQRAGRARARGRAWPIACGRKPPMPGARRSIRPKSSPPIWPRWRSRWRSGARAIRRDGVDRSAARAAMAAREAALAALGALDGEGRITAHGRAMARLPMEPALAHMLLFAARMARRRMPRGWPAVAGTRPGRQRRRPGPAV